MLPATVHSPNHTAWLLQQENSNLEMRGRESLLYTESPCRHLPALAVLSIQRGMGSLRASALVLSCKTPVLC